MALTKQYFSSYKSNNNIDYYCEIWVEDFSGNASEITLGAGGPLIKYDTDSEHRFSSIISSSLELPFVVQGAGTQFFITQLRTVLKERQVYFHLYRATSSTYSTVKPLWSGFLIMDLGAGEDVFFPYEQKLTFVDGLSLLKDIDFVDLSSTLVPPAGPALNLRTQGNYLAENMYYGPATYIFWIREILKKTGASLEDTTGVSKDYGFTTAVNWYNGSMANTNQSSDPLALTKCNVSMFHSKDNQDVYNPKNCYLVLKELLRHWGARITYWKGEFWIVQIPEYITNESGLLDNPDNINSRQYSFTGAFLGSQDHLGSTYYTRYEQNLTNGQISKLTGTKYNYLPMIKEVEADYLSLSGTNYYGGFPYGNSTPFAPSLELFQGRIIDPSTANYLFLSIPLDWIWDMSGSQLTAGHTLGWWCSVKFNCYAVRENTDGSLTTFYLQQNQGDYYWVDKSNWNPLGNASPKYIIKSKNIIETNYIGFQEKISFVDGSGNNIQMLGDWNFYLDIEDYGTSQSNAGSFFCRFSGYSPLNPIKRNPTSTSPNVPYDVGSTSSGTVSWSNSLEAVGLVVASSSSPNIPNFNAGTSQPDSILITTSPFQGFLQAATTTSIANVGISTNTQVTNGVTNSEIFSFGTLLWGDAIEAYALGSLKVKNSSNNFVQTDPDGEWGRGVLTGELTFTNMLINEFLTGQVDVVITPTMRLTVGDANKNQTGTGTGGSVTRPRYINPIGKLREFRAGTTDPIYFFKRGVFYTLFDEWDYEGYQILRDPVTSTTLNNNLGGNGGAQTNNPISNAKIINPTTNALMFNSPIASVSKSVASIGSNVAVNGNFNVAVGWSLGAGWSINTTTNRATFTATGSVSVLSQGVLTQGKPFQINFTINLSAGSLLVKAGTAGTSLNITSSGIYSIYLDCEGSNVIKFEASTTFTGDITGIHIADQKSLTSLPIISLGETVFKTGDTFNLINSNEGEPLVLTVSSNQGATDTAISVNSTLLYEDISINSTILINQDDLSAQYQNKTKGTVAGFDITSTGIAKSSINITDWLNSDTMTGAAVTNVPTALSVKNFVNAQVGASDTLQEVTDNGNTTTNSVRIGSSTAPNRTLSVYASSSSIVGDIRSASGNNSFLSFSNNASTADQVRIGSSSGNAVIATNYTERVRITSSGRLGIGVTNPDQLIHAQSSSDTSIKIEKTGGNYIQLTAGGAGGRIISDHQINFDAGGNSGAMLISSSGNTSLTGSLTGTTATFSGNLKITNGSGLVTFASSSSGDLTVTSGDDIRLDAGGNDIVLRSSGTEFARLTRNSGLQITSSETNANINLIPNGTGQVIVPTTPTLTNSAASKSYVDAQVGASDTLQEVTDNGNTTTNSITFAGGTSTGKLITNLGVEFTGGTIAQATAVLHTNNVIYFRGGSSGLFLQNADGSDGIFIANDFIRFDQNGAEKMRLDSAGRLGVGLTNPSGLIHAKQTANDARIIVETDSNGSNSAGAYFEAKSEYQDYHGLGLFSGTSPIEKWFIGSFGSSYFSIINGKRNDGTKVLNVTTDNRVGIGTTAPDSLLEISSSSTSDFLKLTTAGGGANPIKLVFEKSSVEQGVIEYNRNGDLEIYNTDSDGGVMIDGSSSAGADLYVNNSGNTILTGSLTGTTATFSGQVTIPATPIANTDAASKSYVDAHGGGLGPFLPLTGGTLSGSLTGTTATFNDVFFGTNTYKGKLSWDTGKVLIGTSTASTDIVFVKNSNTELARITSGGNLLLGNTSGTEKLSVSGNIAVPNGSSIMLGGAVGDTKIGKLYNVSGVLSLDGDGTRSIRFGSTTNGEVMRVDNTNQRIGIGTTSPVTKLEVVDSTNAQLEVSGYSVATTTANAANGTIFIGNNASYRGVIDYNASSSSDLIISNTYNNAGNGIRFKVATSDAGGITAMRIMGDGKVGIGTTSPTRLLEVESAADAYIRLQSTASLSGSAIFEMVSGGTGNSFIKSTNNALYLCAEESGVGVIIFRTGGTNEQMRILANGNVGIGTTAPVAKIDILSTGNAQYSSIITTDSDRKIYLGRDAINVTGLAGTSAPAQLYIQGLGGGTTLGGTLTGTSATFSGNSTFNSNFTVGGVLYIDNIQTRSGVNIDFRHQDGTVKMQLKTGTGNLLLGTTTDSGEKLQVNGSAKFTGNLTLSGQTAPQLFLTSNTAGTPNYTLIANASSQFIIGRAGVANDFIIEAGNTTLGGSLTGTTATFSGNLGLGTITPQQKIHIVSTDGSNIILNSNTGAENNGIFMTEGAAASPYTNGAYAHYDSVANAFKINTGTSTLTTKFTILKDSGNILINSTSDNGQKLQVTGNVRITGSFQVANTGGFLLADTGGSMRYGLKYGAAGAVGSSNLLMLTNRSLSSATGGGEVAISANSSTSGVTETEVMRIKANTQSQVSIDGVLSLTSQNTPADPPNRASTIWLDSNYDLKIKITNNSGVTVTKTLAEYA